MKKGLFFIWILFPSLVVQAQSWKWGRGHEEIGAGQSMATGTSVDKIDGVYTVGWYHGTIIFSDDTLTNNIGNGGSRGYIVKHDTSGNYQWSKTTDAGYAYFLDIAVDKFNNIYAIGGYDTGFSIDNQSLSNPYISSTHFPGAAHHFITKISSSGNVLWIKEIGDVWIYGGLYDAVEIKVDTNCNLYVISTFSDTATVGNFVLPNMSTDSSADILVAKYDSSCNVIWARSFGGNQQDACYALDLSPTGEIYIGGNSHSNSILFGSQSIYDDSSSLLNWYQFLVKLDNSGSPIWAIKMNGFLFELATNSVGEVYIAGTYSDTISFGNYQFPAAPQTSSYGYLAKYAPNGQAIWAKNMQGQRVFPLALCTDLCDNVWIHGTMGIINLATADTIDGQIIYAPIGNAWPTFLAGWDKWANNITIQPLITGYDQHPNGLTSDATGKIYLSAETRDIDTFYVANDPIIITNGIRQMFIAKFDPEFTCWPSGVSEVSSSNNINIYPNPANDKVFINTAALIKSVILTNTLGQVVLMQRPGRMQTELDILHLPTGIYFITVMDDTGYTFTQKVLKN